MQINHSEWLKNASLKILDTRTVRTDGQLSILRFDFEPNKAYLNYPTQVIFKCCNLIPVMIGGMLIQKKVYNRFDFLAVMLMTIGLIFFTLGDSESSPDFNATGVSRFSAR